jgi:drug/metabolite transporter (DMT)-like permease
MSAPGRRFSATVEGAFWMILGGSLFAGMSAMIRPASEAVHPLVVSFIRAAVGALVLLPILARAGAIMPPKGVRKVVVLRAISDGAAMALWFFIIPIMPLATAIALNFTSPLFSTIFAVLFLGEVVRRRRWTAIAFGFAGALIILRPGTDALNWASVFVLVSAAAAALSRVAARHLTFHLDAKRIVAYHFLLVTPVLLIPAIPVWTWPDARTLLLIVCLSMLGTMGHFCVTKAMHVAEASEMAPFDYVQLITAALLGYFLFGELPDIWTWAGAAVIAGSTIYIARREAAIRRAALQNGR